MSTQDETNKALAAERAAEDAEDVAQNAKLAKAQADLKTAQADDATDAATIASLEAEVARLEGGSTVSKKRLKLSAIQTFPHRKDFPLYVDFPKVFGHLDALGIKLIRGQCGPGTSDEAMGFYKTAYEQHGIKCLLTIGEPRVFVTDAQWTGIEKKLTTLGVAAIDSIYGWNEPNSVRGGGVLPSDWAKQTANHQKKLAALGKKLGVLVATCAPWSGQPSATWEAMAAVKAAGQTIDDYDIIAYHQYPRDTDTKEEVAAFYGNTETQLRKVLNDPDSPFACTEYGWSTAPKAGASGAVRLTEDERAKRLPLVADYHVSHGNRHSLFELYNTADDTQADREDWLGIVWVDNTRTPAFKAYKAFLAGS